MTVLSRKVTLSKKDLIILDVESCVLDHMDFLSEIIRMDSRNGFILQQGIYTLELGKNRRIELRENEE